MDTESIKRFTLKRQLPLGQPFQILFATLFVITIKTCESQIPGFQCKTTTKIIPREFQCDGIYNCADKSDEENCTSCSTVAFQCDLTKKCIPNWRRCDGVKDCGSKDNSDELLCRSCWGTAFLCNVTKKCIVKAWRCDEYYDCGDGDESDEEDCGCKGDDFQCELTKLCLNAANRCDGFANCAANDTSDEENCEKCQPNTYKCEDGQHCFKDEDACDGYLDCADGSDEQNCLSSDKCKENTEFRCRNGKCFPTNANCNGENDCGDGSDEYDCSKNSCSAFWCEESLQCLQTSKRCNLRYDCEDFSDEEDCPGALELLSVKPVINAQIFDYAIWTINVPCNRNNFTITWRNPKEIECLLDTEKYNMSVIMKTSLLYEVTLMIANITLEDEGFYPLQVKLNGDENDDPKEINLQLLVEDFRLPYILYTNMLNSTLTFTAGETLELVCNVTGSPRTTTYWFWNNVSKNDWPSSFEYSVFQDDQILLFQSVTLEVGGIFLCSAENMNGIVSVYADVVILDKIKNYVVILGSFGAAVSILIIVIGSLILRLRWKQKKLNNLLKGIALGDYANLPGVKEPCEIPRHKLEIGIPLGSGAFGLVFKRTLFGNFDEKETLTVAVKTVKPDADERHLKALITEFKIMRHIGTHPNVVNFIGACTENFVEKKELFVVLEFCKFGSIQSFLLQKRSNFTNQLDPETNEIDPTIGVKKCKEDKIMNSCSEVCDDQDNSRVTSNVTMFNYKEDYEISVMESFKSTDLLNWAFQVALGMEYLSSKNILHGDLAARNVLLGENKIAKICDFGYARELKKDYVYKKNIQGVLLPSKWMAVESIFSGVFSTKSDCWSFGVFLWELFSLGKKPYPDLEINEEFREQLYQGYRMARPLYAPNSLYRLMTHCWKYEPRERPSFSELSIELQELISQVDDKCLNNCE